MNKEKDYMTSGKLVVDFGNSHIKAIGKVGGTVNRLCTHSVYSLGTGLVKDRTVECEGLALGIGIGNKSFNTKDKTDRLYIKHQLLWSAYNTLGGAGTYSIELGVGLPINIYKSKKESYKAQLEQLKTIEGTVNGESITLMIKRVEVYAEGYSAIKLLAKANSIDIQQDTLIIDCGYGTTDVMHINFKDNKLQLVNYKTFEVGLKDILTPLQEQLSMRGIEMPLEEIDRKISSENPVVRTEQGDFDLAYNITYGASITIDLLRDMESFFGKLVLFDKVFIGGGSKYLLSSIDGRIKNVRPVNADNTYYGNALGYLDKLES